MKRISIIAAICLFALATHAQKRGNKITITPKAIGAETKVATEVSIKSGWRSARVTTPDGHTVPCQLDDLNGDGSPDVVFFFGEAGKRHVITLSKDLPQETYEPQVYAELMLTNKKIKEENKQDLYISQLTVDNGTNPYWMLHHHGAAFENEQVAYRIYFDHRQTVDIYGKYRKGLELRQTQFYPDAEQKANGFGDDVLWVGQTLGLGTLRGWDGSKPLMLTDVEHRSQRIVARGPLRTIVEVKDEGWTVVPRSGNDTPDTHHPTPNTQHPSPNTSTPITMTALYTLNAGDRHCTVDIRFEGDADSREFVTGLINVKNSTEHSDGKGLRACWGTDWPVSAKDSVGHKRETVGLGIYIPEEYVVSQQPANKDNYPIVVRPRHNHLRYFITFCSANESWGFKSDDEWYRYLEEWKKTVR